MTNKRIFIELIEKRNANGSLKKKKYFIKPILTMYDSFTALRIAARVEKLEKEQGGIPIDEFEEIFNFIVECFEGQFTTDEMLKGLPAGEEGYQVAFGLLGSIADANQKGETKAFLEEKKD